MDFMKWLNSLDELLYEVMSWLIFFPLTLWKTLRHPLAMMDYADSQLALPQEEQYGDALSPPLFLALALILAHGVSSALGQSDAIIANRHGLGDLVTDDTSALILRLIVFSGFPLMMAARFVRRRHLPLPRGALRMPFYPQCYPAAAFALGISLGATLTSVSWLPARSIGIGLMSAAGAYYVIVGTGWFATKLSIGRPRALIATLLGLTEGFLLLIVAGFLFTR